MPPPSDPLVRLLGVIQSGLSLYLADSGIGSYPGADEVRDALADLASDQRRFVARASEVLVDREQVPPRPHYPLAFTAVHDLDLAALLARVLGDLRRQVPALEAIAAAAGDDAAATTLAREAEASSRRHAATLEQIAVRLRAGLGRPAAAAAQV